MPLLILLGILAIYAIASIYDNIGYNHEGFTHDELEELTYHTIGKSTREVNRYTKKYIRDRKRRRKQESRKW